MFPIKTKVVRITVVSILSFLSCGYQSPSKSNRMINSHATNRVDHGYDTNDNAHSNNEAHISNKDLINIDPNTNNRSHISNNFKFLIKALVNQEAKASNKALIYDDSNTNNKALVTSNLKHKISRVKKFRTKVVYGDDDRLDLYQIDPLFLELASSTVALVDKSKVKQISNQQSQLDSNVFGDFYNLCEEEPFKEQPIAAFCSGFLVGKETIVSAGHCLRLQSQCENTLFVFDYALHSPGQDATIIENENIYECEELLHSEVKGNGPDFSIVKLKRIVKNRSPLKMRLSGQASEGDQLFVVGHPAGLPSKLAGGASVRAQKTGYLQANLDTYGGNSGSAVFNSQTLEVEGILVRGEMDFAFKNNCRVSNKCSNSECRGEDVTHISEVQPFL